MSLAACSNSAPTPATVVASPLALQHGVASYVIGADAVSLREPDGALLGTLRLTSPSEDTRLVVISYAAGRQYENEVTRPIADGSFHAPVTSTREGAIQADPALASFFATAALSFELVEQPSTAGLTTQGIAYCYDIPWTAGCAPSACSTSGWWSGGTYVTVAVGYAECPPSFCPPLSNDVVRKDRTCNDPGSCSNQAQGFQYCSNFGSCGNGCWETSDCEHAPEYQVTCENNECLCEIR